MSAIHVTVICSMCWQPVAMMVTPKLLPSITIMFLRLIGARSLELRIIGVVASTIVVLLLSLFIAFSQAIDVCLLSGAVVANSAISLIVSIKSSLTNSVVACNVVVA